MYQLHGFDPETPIDETLEALDSLVRAGKVRYIGCSNCMAFLVARATGRSEARSDCVQPRHNVLYRVFERDLFPLCLEERIGIISYNPIAGGVLSGKHDTSGLPTHGTRFTLGTAAQNCQQRYWHQRLFDSVDQLRGVAADAVYRWLDWRWPGCAVNRRSGRRSLAPADRAIGRDARGSKHAVHGQFAIATRCDHRRLSGWRARRFAIAAVGVATMLFSIDSESA